MNNRKPYQRIFTGCRMLIVHYILVLFLCLIVLFSNEAIAQYAFDGDKAGPPFSYDELPVEVYMNGTIGFSTYIIVTNTDLLYIHVEDLFKNLNIFCIVGNDGNNLTGFIENESKPYKIDFNEKQINVGNISMNAPQGLVKEMGSVYIESSLLKDAFGLTVTFKPRSLYIDLKSNFELPLVKKMRIEKMRQNISKLQGEPIVADTTINRNYHLFNFGMIDWAVSSYQTRNEPTSDNLSIGVGSELLYGEANISVNYNDRYKFDNRQLQYMWRWVDNDKTLIRQAQLGKIYNQTIAFINSPVIGASIKNTPTTVRKASGFYDITEHTEPNWTVELYINDVLVDYTTADASGLFVFKVPIVYGYTILKLKFYGPLGEERTEERTLNVPFTFMAANTFEYGLTAGVLENVEQSRFGQGNFNYGVNRFLTVGGGVEYLSSIPDKPFIPFARIAFQPFSKLVVNLEYAHDVRIKGLLNYYITKSAFLEIDYAKYVEGQLATSFNALEERKVRISVPFKKNSISGYAKLNFNQFIYKSFDYNQVDFTFSAYYKQLSANSSSQMNWIDQKSAYTTTDLSLSYKTKKGLTFRPSAQYNLTDASFVRLRAEIEKRVSRTYFSVSYERNVLSQSDNFYLSFKYDLPFARTSASASFNNKQVRFSESAQGSMAFGGDSKSIKTGNNSSVGKGGILFYPFLDLNQNGVRDQGEKMVLLSTVKISGGKAIISETDSIVRISDLNAFVSYNIGFSDADLDNIAWRIKYNTYQVLVDPNQYKKVLVPIIVVGEINGMVYKSFENGLRGIGRITVQIFNMQGEKVAETLSESDGYFSYLGLKPGEYVVKIDEGQLESLEYQSAPLMHDASIEVSVDGDIAGDIDFVLTSIKN